MAMRVFERDTAALQDRAGLTTFTHARPCRRLLMLSAIVRWRRRIVPEVQPDMCGVMTTFGNVWNGSDDGSAFGAAGEG